MWAVVQTEPVAEFAVQHRLGRAGFGTYLPLVAGHTRTVPLFPTYLFVEIERAWYEARWQPGVLRMLMSGDHPARLPDRIVTELRGRERRGVVILPKRPRFTRGQTVRVTQGAFSGHVAIYESQTGADRQRVLLQLLGQAVRVELPLT